LVLRPDLTFAQFIGPYTLEPPAPGSYTVFGVNPFPVGNWAGRLNGGSALFINTSASPDFLVLSASASARPVGGWISARAAASGIVTFDYTITGSGNGFVNWFNSGFLDQGPIGVTTGVTTLNSDPVSGSITVNEGDYFGFYLTVEGSFPIGGLRTFSIQNFSAPVPEPSSRGIFTAAAIFGILVMLGKRRARESH